MPLLPERGFAPDLGAIAADARERARLMYLNYPNNPTGAIVPDGLFEEAVEFGRENDVLVVHDASYTETTFDGYVAPSFLADAGREGRRRRGLLAVEGLQHDRLAHGRDRRQRGRDRGLLAAQDEHRLGHVRRGPAGGGRHARRRATSSRARCAPIYQRRRDLVVRRAAGDRRRRHAAEGHDLHLGAGAAGLRLRLLRRARARGVRRRGLARRRVRPERRGLLPHLADRARRAPERGGRAAAVEPRRASRCTTAASRSERARTTCACCARCAPRSRRSASRPRFYEPGAPAQSWRGSARSATSSWRSPRR